MTEIPVSGDFAANVRSVAEAAAVTGAAVRKSPQAQALLAFARALSKEDLKGAQPHAAGDLASELADLKKMLGPDAVKELVKEQFGDIGTLERRLGSAEASLRESADAATIALTKKTKDQYGESTETTTFRFVRDGGTWKVKM